MGFSATPACHLCDPPGGYSPTDFSLRWEKCFFLHSRFSVCVAVWLFFTLAKLAEGLTALEELIFSFKDREKHLPGDVST